MLAVDGRYPFPSRLQISIARHIDAATTHQHLRKTGAVIAQARAATPRIGHSEEAPLSIAKTVAASGGTLGYGTDHEVRLVLTSPISDPRE